jgi:hypothetical protein
LKNPSLQALVVATSLAFSATSADAARITVCCDQQELVESRRLWVVRVQRPNSAEVPPIHRFPSLILQNGKHSFNKRGVCELNLPEGVYQFHVLGRNGDTIVALSSGDKQIKDDATIKLRSQAPVTPQVRHKGNSIPIISLQVRVRGIPLQAEEKRGFWEHEDSRVMVREAWRPSKNSGKAGPKLILSPGQSYPTHIVAIQGDTHAVIWKELRADEPTCDLGKLDLRELRFKWAGDDRSLATVVDPEWILYLPDQDTVTLPLRKDTRLLTNRHWLESSYGYRTKSGEKIHFVRRARLFPPGTSEVRWGGALKASAYARVLMQWGKPEEAVVWGAYLHNAQNDVVHTFDAKDKEYKCDTPLSEIEWSARLIRTDGKKIPTGILKGTRLGSIPVTKSYLKEEIGDIDAPERVFAIEVAYRLNGEKVSLKLPPVPFVTWRSKRVSLEAPREWAGQAGAYLDKAERIMDYCIQKQRTGGIEHLQLFWTNNWGAGWTNTTRPAKHKRMQMSFEDLRRRQSIFDLPDIFVHEMLHAYGYEHGGEQDQAIRFIETVYLYHRHALADHPEYEPSSVKLLREIESARNRGDRTYGKFNKIKVR